MPAVVFSPEDEALIEELLKRLDPEQDPEVRRLADKVSPEDWTFLVDYIRHDLRQQAQMAMIAKAVVVTAQKLGLADRSGAENVLTTDGFMLSNFGRAWEQGARAHGETERYLAICTDSRRAGNDETNAALAHLIALSDDLRSTILDPLSTAQPPAD